MARDVAQLDRAVAQEVEGLTEGALDVIPFEALEELYELVCDGFDNLATIATNASWCYHDWYGWETTQQLFSLGETFAHLVKLAQDERIEILNEGRYLHRFRPIL